MTSRFQIPKPSTLLLINLGLLAIFWLAMPLRLTETHAVVIQCARAAISIMVCVTYLYAWLSVARDPERNLASPEWALTAGICLAFMADAFGACLGIAWRWYNKPVDWTMLSLWAFSPYLTAIAGIHHIVAPGAINGRIPKRNMILAGVAIGLASLVAGLIIGFRIRDFGVSL